MEELVQNSIDTVHGDLECRKCRKKYIIGYDLKKKLNKVVEYVVRNKGYMRARAPEVWMKPVRPPCVYCGKDDGVRPVMGRKRCVNWLFLLLSGFLGFCCIKQLKYFCKHNNTHRSGAKNRLSLLLHCSSTSEIRWLLKTKMIRGSTNDR